MDVAISTIWVFPKIGVPENGWFIVENPIKMDDLGIPLFLETHIFFSHNPSCRGRKFKIKLSNREYVNYLSRKTQVLHILGVAPSQ